MRFSINGKKPVNRKQKRKKRDNSVSLLKSQYFIVSIDKFAAACAQILKLFDAFPAKDQCGYP